jgi:hypothetical protein
MTTIHVDDQVAHQLEVQARKAGMSVSEYLRTLVPAPPASASRPSWDEIEREIDSLSAPEATLPPDFSRVDIYSDHD